jgi:hypothetical protein
MPTPTVPSSSTGLPAGATSRAATKPPQAANGDPPTGGVGEPFNRRSDAHTAEPPRAKGRLFDAQ